MSHGKTDMTCSFLRVKSFIFLAKYFSTQNTNNKKYSRSESRCFAPHRQNWAWKCSLLLSQKRYYWQKIPWYFLCRQYRLLLKAKLILWYTHCTCLLILRHHQNRAGWAGIISRWHICVWNKFGRRKNICSTEEYFEKIWKKDFPGQRWMAVIL